MGVRLWRKTEEAYWWVRPRGWFNGGDGCGEGGPSWRDGKRWLAGLEVERSRDCTRSIVVSLV